MRYARSDRQVLIKRRKRIAKDPMPRILTWCAAFMTWLERPPYPNEAARENARNWHDRVVYRVQIVSRGWGASAVPASPRGWLLVTRRRSSMRMAEPRKAAPQCGHRHNRGVCVQLAKERLGIFQIDCVEALGEPAVDGREKITGFHVSPLVAP